MNNRRFFNFPTNTVDVYFTYCTEALADRVVCLVREFRAVTFEKA